jgi:hypothetical protein
MASSATGHPGVKLTRWISANARKASGIFLVVMALGACACRQTAREPVTLSYFRLGWAQPDELPTAEGLSQRFTRETGIRLKSIPVPETTLALTIGCAEPIRFIAGGQAKNKDPNG